MKTIKLTKGINIIIDDEDYEYCSRFKWHARKSKNNYYAQRGDYCPINRKTFTSILHRELMLLKTGDTLLVDHINGNTLDNRKENLRVCTYSESAKNVCGNKNTSSKYKGVSFYKPLNKWCTKINCNKTTHRLGYFNSETKAMEAYNKKAKELHKEFARLNKDV